MNTEEILEIIKNQPVEQIWLFGTKHKTPIKALVFNVEYNAMQYPDTFHIPSMQVRQNLAVGAIVKINVDWQKDYLLSERFWVEVTNVTTDREGEVCYFGVARNDTFVASYDTPIGPFYPRHIGEVDLAAFTNTYELALAA